MSNQKNNQNYNDDQSSISSINDLNKDILIKNLNRLSQQITNTDINNFLNDSNISDNDSNNFQINKIINENNIEINEINEKALDNEIEQYLNEHGSVINYNNNNNNNNSDYEENEENENEENENEENQLNQLNRNNSADTDEFIIEPQPISPLLPPIIIENNFINDIDLNQDKNIINNNNNHNNNNNNNNNNTPFNNNKFFKINNRLVEKSVIVNFNIGGTLFSTSIRSIILYQNSLLYKIVEFQIDLILNDEIIFIDRSPLYFSTILDYIRTGRYTPDPSINSKGLLLETDFYGLQELSALVRDESELTRADIVKIINSSYDYPRLRGLWLMKINFSGLSMESTNFEYSNLSYSIFNSTFLKEVNMRGTKLEKSIIRNCDMRNSNLSKSLIINATFQNNLCNSLIGNGINFNGSNLSRTRFSGSDLSESNFNSTNLDGTVFDNCNLSSCDFRNSIITPNTIFTHSNNIKGTLFDNLPSLSNTTFNNNSGSSNKSKTWKKIKSIKNKF